VGQQPHDNRSIASSVATRDDKSIFEEPGLLDATEGAGKRVQRALDRIFALEPFLRTFF
jgi:hypothetical protein